VDAYVRGVDLCYASGRGPEQKRHRCTSTITPQGIAIPCHRGGRSTQFLPPEIFLVGKRSEVLWSPSGGTGDGPSSAWCSHARITGCSGERASLDSVGATTGAFWEASRYHRDLLEKWGSMTHSPGLLGRAGSLPHEARDFR